MATILDVSNVQGNSIDWSRVKRAGIDAVWMKATEGLTFNDGRFHEWRKQANAVGLRVGAYHFARPDLHPTSAEEEAAHFCAAVGKVGRTDLKPVLDYELHAAVIRPSDWIRRFNAVVRKELGGWPVFYTYAGLVPELDLHRPVGNGLWLAAYGRNDGREHSVTVPAPWHKLVAHQFSSNCVIAGIPGHVDLSHAPSLRPLLAHPVVGRL